MPKVTAYTQLSTPATGDKIPIVDISDTSMAATGTTKYVEYGDLQPGIHWLQYSIPGTLTTGVGAIPIPIPTACNITAYRVKAGTAPTGDSIILDFNIDGTTAFTTQGNRPTIAISGTTSTTTLPDVVAVAAGSYLTIDVDQIGSTVAGANVGIMIELTES